MIHNQLETLIFIYKEYIVFNTFDHPQLQTYSFKVVRSNSRQKEERKKNIVKRKRNCTSDQENSPPPY